MSGDPLVTRGGPSGVPSEALTGFGGWCAPTEVLYSDLPVRPIVFGALLPTLADLVEAERHVNAATVERWHAEEDWLLAQLELCRPVDDEEVTGG